MELDGVNGYSTNIGVESNEYNTRFWGVGDCMDSPDAPIRIKDGQRLRVHGLDCGDGKYPVYSYIYSHLKELKGKVCAIIYVIDGKRYGVVKELVGIDELAGALRLAFYYPKKTYVGLKLDTIEKIYIVDGVEE